MIQKLSNLRLTAVLLEYQPLPKLDPHVSLAMASISQQESTQGTHVKSILCQFREAHLRLLKASECQQSTKKASRNTQEEGLSRDQTDRQVGTSACKSSHVRAGSHLQGPVEHLKILYAVTSTNQKTSETQLKNQSSHPSFTSRDARRGLVFTCIRQASSQEGMAASFATKGASKQTRGDCSAAQVM